MAAPTAGPLPPGPDLELLRVSSTILSILFGGMLLLFLATSVFFALTNGPSAGPALLTMGTLGCLLVGTLVGTSSRYARAYTRRWDHWLRMTKAERHRRRALVSIAAPVLLLLYFSVPALVGTVLWPGQGWADDEIAVGPEMFLVAAAGFALYRLWGFLERPSPALKQAA